jgi:hypothetical protein
VIDQNKDHYITDLPEFAGVLMMNQNFLEEGCFD